MKKFAIILDEKIVHKYEAEEIQVYGGPWGSSEAQQVEYNSSWEYIKLNEQNEIVEDVEFINSPEHQKALAQQAFHQAKAFGLNLLDDFILENVMLGITQAGKTAEVKNKVKEVILSLQTGSLYDAIEEAKKITDFDDTFVTEARILSFVNRIETFLGLELSEEL